MRPAKVSLVLDPNCEYTHLVDTHRVHVEQLGNGVHRANADPVVVLTLSNVENGHDGGLLVLGRITSDNLLNLLHAVGVELEGDRGVVVCRVTVLCRLAYKSIVSLFVEIPCVRVVGWAGPVKRTIMRLSDRLALDDENVLRLTAREALERAERMADMVYGVEEE